MSDKPVVFICRPMPPVKIKIQLEINPETLEHFKALALEMKVFTAKQIMENILNNSAAGVEGG